MKVDLSKVVIVANLVVIAMLVYVLVNIFTIPLVGPVNGAYVTERTPELLWGSPHGRYELLVDDDPGFESPFVINVLGKSFKFMNALDFGTYFWKVRSGIFSSNVGKFTVGSNVALSRKGAEVKNDGNTDVVLYSTTGAMILGVDSSIEVGEEENVKAEQI